MSYKHYMLEGKTSEEKDKIIGEQMEKRGIFNPRRTCPLGNGVDIWDERGKYCHRDCAWAIEEGVHCVIPALSKGCNTSASLSRRPGADRQSFKE